MSATTPAITIIDAIECARGLHDPDAGNHPDEYPEYSRGMANILGDLYGFDQDDITEIIAVIRHQVSVARFAVEALQIQWMSGGTPSGRQITTKQELADWLVHRPPERPDTRAQNKDQAADGYTLLGQDRHQHRYSGQAIQHSHPGGAASHGYYEHPQDNPEGA